MDNKSIFYKALELKDEIFGEKIGWITPKDISPHVNSWFLGFFACVLGIFVGEGWLEIGLYVFLFLVMNWSFYRSVVKL